MWQVLEQVWERVICSSQPRHYRFKLPMFDSVTGQGTDACFGRFATIPGVPGFFSAAVEF